MSRKKVHNLQRQCERERVDRLSNMDNAQQKELEALWEIHCPVERDEDGDDTWETVDDFQPMDVDQVLHDEASIDLSHAGGEFHDILDSYSDMKKQLVYATPSSYI